MLALRPAPVSACCGMVACGFWLAVGSVCMAIRGVTPGGATAEQHGWLRLHGC